MSKKVWLYIFFLYSAFIVYGCTVPFDIGVPAAEIISKIKNILWIPYTVSHVGYRQSKIDVASNLLLFMPFGFLLASYFIKRTNKFIIYFIICFSSITLSSFVEFLQLFTKDRVTSTTDICNNLCGGLAGAFLAGMYHKRFHNMVKPVLLRLAVKHPVQVYVLFIIAGVFFFKLIPFDVSSDVDNIKHNVKFIIHNLYLMPHWENLQPAANNFLLFSLSACGLYAAYFQKNHFISRLFSVIFINAAISLSTEFTKIFIISGNPCLSNIFFALLGTVNGLICGIFLRDAKAGKFRGFYFYSAFIYMLFFIFNYFYPFELTLDWQSKISKYSLIPFAIYFFKIDAGNMSDIFLQIFMFIPFGFFPIKSYTRGYIYPFLAGFLCGVVFESAQIFIMTRHFDITDAFLGGFGALSGYFLVVNFYKIRQSITKY